MKKLLGRIFAGPEAGNSIIDGVKSGIDKAVFSTQERAETAMEAFQLWIEYQKATSGQNLARRLIALMAVATWLFLVLVTVVVGLVEFFVFGSTAFPAAQFVLTVNTSIVQPVVLTIIAFYFGKGIIDQGTRAWTETRRRRKKRDQDEDGEG